MCSFGSIDYGYMNYETNAIFDVGKHWKMYLLKKEPTTMDFNNIDLLRFSYNEVGSFTYSVILIALCLV